MDTHNPPPNAIAPPMTQPAPPPRHRARRWLALAVIVMAGLLALDWILGGESPSRGVDERAAPYVLQREDLAAAVGGAPDAFVQTSPPIDVAQAERAVRGISAGHIPLPDARSVISYRQRDSGSETTSVVLIYDDPTKAQSVDRLAIPLLRNAFDLQPSPLTMEGVEDARLWTAPNYRAVSFRRGGVVAFVGTTATADPRLVERLAELARDRIRAQEASTSPASPTT